jgi:multisubunit Na+/H+ antiporter MnhF subunit
MLIVTETGEAINAHHTVRFFLQSDQAIAAEATGGTRYRLMLQLTNRQRVIAADGLDKEKAIALFQEVVRAWTRGQACIDIAACLKRLQKGETGPTGFSEVCL